jgi:hypothetical protein
MKTEHPLVADYLARLSAEAQRLPADQASELVADIQEHLASALPAGSSESDIRNTIDRLGTPGEVVAAAMPPDVPPPPRQRSGWFEAGAIICLLAAELGFFLLPISPILWLIGLVLLAISTVWTVREKIIGFLGLGTGFVMWWVVGAMALVTSTTQSCSGTQGMTADGTLIGEATSSCGPGLEWFNYLAIGLTIAYIVFQVYAVWVLVRAARR